MIFCKLYGLIKVGRNVVFLSIQSMILEKILTSFQMRHWGHDYAKKTLMCYKFCKNMIIISIENRWDFKGAQKIGRAYNNGW